MIAKRSGKPFKDGCKVTEVLGTTINPYTGNAAYLVDANDGIAHTTSVDCHQCVEVDNLTVTLVVSRFTRGDGKGSVDDHVIEMIKQLRKHAHVADVQATFS